MIFIFTAASRFLSIWLAATAGVTTGGMSSCLGFEVFLGGGGWHTSSRKRQYSITIKSDTQVFAVAFLEFQKHGGFGSRSRGWFVYSSVASAGKPSLDGGDGATCASSSESGENIKVGTENQQWKLTLGSRNV